MSPKSQPAPHGQLVLAVFCSCRWRAWPGFLKVCWELGCCLLGARVVLGSCGIPPSSSSSLEREGDGFWVGETLGAGLERDAVARSPGDGQGSEGSSGCEGSPISLHQRGQLMGPSHGFSWPPFPPLELSLWVAINPQSGPIQTASWMGGWSTLAQG